MSRENEYKRKEESRPKSVSCNNKSIYAGSGIEPSDLKARPDEFDRF